MTAFHTMTVREFGQNASGATNLAKDGPVLITERGEPAFVLLNVRDFRELTGQRPTGSIVDGMACPASADIEFDPPRSDERLAPWI
jgi:prevent-host-death family protein